MIVHAKKAPNATICGVYVHADTAHARELVNAAVCKEARLCIGPTTWHVQLHCTQYRLLHSSVQRSPLLGLADANAWGHMAWHAKRQELCHVFILHAMHSCAVPSTKLPRPLTDHHRLARPQGLSGPLCVLIYSIAKSPEID